MSSRFTGRSGWHGVSMVPGVLGVFAFFSQSSFTFLHFQRVLHDARMHLWLDPSSAMTPVMVRASRRHLSAKEGRSAAAWPGNRGNARVFSRNRVLTAARLPPVFFSDSGRFFKVFGPGDS